MSLDRKLNERHRIGGCRCVWDRTFTDVFKIILRMFTEWERCKMSMPPWGYLFIFWGKMRNHSRRLRRSGQSCRKRSQVTEAAWNLKETWEHSSKSHGLARVNAEGLNCPKSPTLVFSFLISTGLICLCTGVVPLGSYYLCNSKSKTRHFNRIISRSPFLKYIFSLLLKNNHNKHAWTSYGL